MPRYAQIVMGPAGSGKSTYCSRMHQHFENSKRTAFIINLDPAAEYFSYPVLADIRELIEVDDVMQDSTLSLGPNGGLVFCMEYFAKNFDWLEEQIGETDGDYFIFDCPGQIELYTHIPVMRQLVELLQGWDFRLCGLFLIDSQFMIDTSKFFSGTMSALSTMVNLEIPHINVMTKMDLLSAKDKQSVEKFLDPDTNALIGDLHTNNKKFEKLNQAIAALIDDYSLVKFTPLNYNVEETIEELLLNIDMTLQYDEDQEVRPPPDIDPDDDVDSGVAEG
ncbi:GPN-loop GTPase 3-like [Antedon mediterranea]|uniref:GPN-loop GTPase 3-like n=1 Tax=Antedon mediterranea TaxID=105859 RepID=UPI003AF83C36